MGKESLNNLKTKDEIVELKKQWAHKIGSKLGVIRGRAELTLIKSGAQTPIHDNMEIIIRQVDEIVSYLESECNP